MRRIAIHGLGYVGLTAAIHFAKAGWEVTGYDPDAETVSKLNAGSPRAGEFLGYLDFDVVDLVEEGRIHATTEFHRTLNHDIHLVAVPTERDGEPFDAIVEDVIERLYKGNMISPIVLIESTLTPGTVDRIIKRLDIQGRFHLAVCPRRDWFADPEKNLETLPRIVGGVGKEATARAELILRTVSRRILRTDHRTAELTKALENALLHVPVMFAYQLAFALPDHDVAEALRLAGTHWRLPQLYLGFGTGGRCVPLGTKYLDRIAKGKLPMARAAIRWDEQFRYLIADSVFGRAPVPKKALILGIAYRPDFRDWGSSPGLGVAHALAQWGVDVHVYDPLWEQHELQVHTGMSVPSSAHLREHGLKEYDTVLLATPHGAFLTYPRIPQIWREGQFVLDAQGAWEKERDKFDSYGVQYYKVGEPQWLPKTVIKKESL